jgi:hypothetical protein
MVFGYNILERAGRVPESKDFSSTNLNAARKTCQFACLPYKTCDVGVVMMIDGCIVGLPNIHGAGSPRFLPCSRRIQYSILTEVRGLRIMKRCLLMPQNLCYDVPRTANTGDCMKPYFHSTSRLFRDDSTLKLCPILLKQEASPR